MRRKASETEVDHKVMQGVTIDRGQESRRSHLNGPTLSICVPAAEGRQDILAGLSPTWYRPWHRRGRPGEKGRREVERGGSP